MQTIPVHTPGARYDVVLGTGLLPSLAPRLDALGGGSTRRSFAITSPGIWALWSGPFLSSFAPGAAPVPLFVPAGEQHKRLSTVEALAGELHRHGADRSSLLLALGGGVIGDLTGFLAAIYMRGIPYVGLPTTLLAQVDASIGGKTGVNLECGKNLLGAFHHPSLVLADTAVLSTLPQAELRAGLFEGLKAGLIRSRALFTYMEEHRDDVLSREPGALTRVVADSVRIKAEVVAADEREAGLRMILNFGHTIGHALETATGYTALLHGEAVGWGMLVALELSQRRGLLSRADAEAAAAVLRSYGLPELPQLDLDRIVRATAGDKKNLAGRRRFILLHAIGEAVVVEDVDDRELLAAAEATLQGTAA